MTKRIAIIGFSFRLPGTTAEQYWQNLLDGADLVTQVAADRWAQDSLFHPGKKHPGTSYTFAAGSIGDISAFDAGFFGISPREAAMMDPQQRLLLEMSWEALENAGVKPSSIAGSQCGVFIGIASADYSFQLADDLCAIDASAATGNTTSIAANRISYVFDLHGPSMAIDTACSSSLVAFHQACRSILSGECLQALTGGVSLHIHPNGFISFSKAGMLSTKGRCRVFDAAADGYVRSEGGGIFFLKDYDQALADGNNILAVVANTAVNTDGRKSGLTVPNIHAQAELLRNVYSQAGIDPSSIDYLEAHGTGTPVGDPIETHAIGEALGKTRTKPLPIGSIKSNLGHLEAASGVAGLTKALLSIQHRMVPATIGIDNPNPYILSDDWNIKLVTENLPLPKTGVLIIGVNSFGFGGANAHIILQSHTAKAAIVTTPKPAQTLPLLISARDKSALKAAAADLCQFITLQPELAFYDIAYNGLHHREWHEHRAVFYAEDAKSATAALLQFSDDNNELTQVKSGTALKKPNGPAFIYSGNGSQWLGMGKQLMATEPEFKAAIEEIDRIFQIHADFSLVDELNGLNGDHRYDRTEIAQPALFALQVGITRMLQAYGVEAVAVAGHSVGEVAAAWAAGALSLEDAVAVIYYRSHYQGTTKGCGGMTAVGLSAVAVEELMTELNLQDALCIAGVNSSAGVTLAGETSALGKLEAVLQTDNIFYKRLDLDYAFHSPAMNGIKTGIKQTLATVQAHSNTSADFYSTVSGDLLAGERLDADYWWRNIRQPVLFKQTIDRIMASGINIFIEIGPHTVLRSYIHDSAKTAGTEAAIITTGTRNHGTALQIRQAASQAIIAGSRFHPDKLFPVAGNFLPLPNYPWQRERHWLPVTAEANGSCQNIKVHPLLGYPLKQMELCWENQLDTQLNPMLADHIVGDALIFPSTGFSELVIAACLLWRPGEYAQIEELEIHAPLLLSKEQSQLLRLSIDNRDGSLSIKARPYCSDENWTQHAVARIIPGSSNEMLQQQAELQLPDRLEDFNTASHALLTQALGFNYGPAFQCLDHGWIEANSVLAVLKIPPALKDELSNNHLHPAILDCTFQLIIQLLRDEVQVNSGFTYIPTRMGRIDYRSGLGEPALVRATLLRRSTHSLKADFAVFDAQGRTIALISDVRMRSIRLNHTKAEQLRFLDYHGIPMPLALDNGGQYLISFKRIRAAFTDVVKFAALKGTHRLYSEEVDPLLDSLCNRFTLQALQQLASADNKITAAELHGLQSAHPEIEPYIQHLLIQAQEDQFIHLNHEGCCILPDHHEQATALDIWNTLLADYPDYFQIIHSVGSIGMHLPELLSGETDFNAVNPHATTRASLLKQILGNEGKHNIGQALRKLITHSLQNLPEGQRLGILEISAGFPQFIIDVCVSMDFSKGDYCYTSTSQNNLDDIDRLKERYPNINSQLLDTQTNHFQAMGKQRYQIAIITLDFQALEHSILAIEYARHSLIGGGALLIVNQHPSRWADFVFGAQRQNWSQTRNAMWLSKQRPAEFWLEHLNQLRHTDIELLEFSPNTQSGPYLLLSKLPAHAMPVSDKVATQLPRSWIIIADEQNYSAQLSNQLTTDLQKRGDIVIQSAPDDSQQLANLLTDTTHNFGELDGLIYLAGLAVANTSAALALENQISRCSQVINIVKACEASATKTTCWLICSDATPELLPTRNPDVQAAATIPQDTTLWAFGRTLLNEASDFSVKLINLEMPQTLDRLSATLLQEFSHTDAEQEIIISHQGARYVPRLGFQTSLTDHQDTEQFPQIRLAFPFPGQLRNLRWEAYPAQHIGDHDVEVEVMATGLNFRDVMYALGMLADEAIENGFAGPTLGLEFSGIVRKLGNKVSQFMPGDQVVGFGPSSFGKQVTTPASAITHIPPGISFEAAATIPSVFFTAYYALHHLAQLQANEKILIHGAAGGVGIAAIQIAKWKGAEIFATAGSAEKHDFLRLMGVNHILDSRSLTFADEIMALTGQTGIDVVLNSLSGEAINRNFQILKPFGRFLELGKRDFYENTKIGLRPFRNNISYFGIDADQLMFARPDLTHRLFEEVMSLFVNGVLHPLPYHSFEAENIVDAFRYMQQSRQIGKIIITYRDGINNIHYPSATRKPSLQLDPDGCYLVSGGLSGFGLKTAQWLVDKGAHHLLLFGRSGAVSAEAQTALAAFKQQGVSVHAETLDITNFAALQLLVDSVKHGPHPLKGIVHAAAVFKDGLIRNMDTTQLRAVMNPKVLGAQYLHELTLDCKLDFFLLYSSAVTLFGNPGQANYVAANACLDALALHRRALGLPATSIRWGAIDDVGFLARNETIKTALQNRMGGSAIHSALAFEVLEQILFSGASNLGVMELDWRALSRFLPSAATPKFTELAQRFGSVDDGNDENLDFQQLLAELSDTELQPLMAAMIKAEVAEILRIAEDRIDTSRSIYDMGLDSLMGVELVIALEARFGVKLPIMSLSQTPTIDKLAERLVQQLRNRNEPAETASETMITDQTKILLDQHDIKVDTEAVEQFVADFQSTNSQATTRLIQSHDH
jgi:acyl transferase domain-containing protein/NADPH:quinone reductase-like Zn-dependent oxidoreductase/acyl carrier protein/NADP-dependent 3-hydroxy acid dehydrogenase YdfG